MAFHRVLIIGSTISNYNISSNNIARQEQFDGNIFKGECLPLPSAVKLLVSARKFQESSWIIIIVHFQVVRVLENCDFPKIDEGCHEFSKIIMTKSWILFQSNARFYFWVIVVNYKTSLIRTYLFRVNAPGSKAVFSCTVN